MSDTNDFFDDALEEGAKAAIGAFLARSPLGKVFFFIVALAASAGIGIMYREDTKLCVMSGVVAIVSIAFSFSGWKNLSSSLMRFMRICMLTLLSAALLTGLYIGLIYIPGDDYSRAMTYMEKGDYEKAKKCFESLEDFKDSKEKAAECETWLQYIKRHRNGSGLTAEELDLDYNRAVEYMEAGKYELAKVWFDWLGDYKDSPEKSQECTNYIEIERILKMLSEPQLHTTAYRSLRNLKGFPPADELLASAEFQAIRERALAVGGYIWFGRWSEQDSIPWKIIARDGDKALILCDEVQIRWALAEMADVTWADCTLRQWLNQDFLQTHFTAAEQAVICPTMLDNGNDGMHNTQDQVFLLSAAEAFQYIPAASSRQVYKYVNDNHYYTWLLRITGVPGASVQYINVNGELEEDNTKIGNLGVRPAMWVILDPDFF